MRSFAIALLFVITGAYSHAYECDEITDQERLEKAKYVFVGKISEKNEEFATVQVLNTYKGSLGRQVKIHYPTFIAKNYRVLKHLKIGESYLFSSNSDLKGEDLNLHHCDSGIPSADNLPQIKFLEKQTKKK